MKSKELVRWMNKNRMCPKDLAHFLGITPVAVDHWLHERRRITYATSKVLKFFEKHPEMRGEF